MDTQDSGCAQAQERDRDIFSDRHSGRCYSALAERIYREGNNIGNHTFTHPDISNIFEQVCQLELNLTEQLFASRLGIRTILFRPPYSIDAEPDTEDQVRPLELTQNLGYVTIGDKVDPKTGRTTRRKRRNRSRTGARPPATMRAERFAVRQHHSDARWRWRSRANRAGSADHYRRARARGFQIVLLYELMGKTRADVMPPLPRTRFGRRG